MGKEITGSNISLELDSGTLEMGNYEKMQETIRVGDYRDTGFKISPMEIQLEIIVFTSSGKTYNFKNVENLTPTTQGFEFDYTGMATGVQRHASFNYTSVAGYAIA